MDSWMFFTQVLGVTDILFIVILGTLLTLQYRYSWKVHKGKLSWINMPPVIEKIDKITFSLVVLIAIYNICSSIDTGGWLASTFIRLFVILSLLFKFVAIIRGNEIKEKLKCKFILFSVISCGWGSLLLVQQIYFRMNFHESVLRYPFDLMVLIFFVVMGLQWFKREICNVIIEEHKPIEISYVWGNELVSKTIILEQVEIRNKLIYLMNEDKNIELIIPMRNVVGIKH